MSKTMTETNAPECIAYESLSDSVDDSAYGLFRLSDPNAEPVIVRIGPGFDPDGSNRPGWCWGCADYAGYLSAGFRLSTSTYAERLGPDVPMIRFDAWGDDRRVKAVMQMLLHDFTP